MNMRKEKLFTLKHFQTKRTAKETAALLPLPCANLFCSDFRFTGHATIYLSFFMVSLMFYHLVTANCHQAFSIHLDAFKRSEMSH